VTVVAVTAGFNRLSGPTVLGNGDVQMGFAGIPGSAYALDWTASLSLPVVWTPVTTNQASDSGALNFTVTPPGPTGYYRSRYVANP
jgi:hypothetical protein